MGGEHLGENIMASGGYRKPTNPAPVSGPGKASRRTDGGPTDMKQNQVEITGMGYGENKDLNEIQSLAPLSAAPSAPSMPSTIPSTPMAMPTPLTAPTERPNEPVTAGMDFGPGIGSEGLVLPNQGMSEEDRQRTLLVLNLLSDAAKKPNATNATLQLIRQLRSEL
jgi:hypothetical protein